MELLKEQKPRTITLKDRTFTLSPLNLNVLEAIEDEFGSLNDMTARLKNKPMSSIKKLLHILASENHPEVTPAEFGRLVEVGDLEGLSARLNEILR